MRITRLDLRLFASGLLSLLQAAAGLCGLVLTVDAAAKIGRISGALSRGAEPSEVARYFLLELPRLALVSLPVSLALACAFSVARFVRKREHIVVLSGGISLHRALAPLLALGLLAAFSWFALAEWVVPAATLRRTALKASLFARSDMFRDAVAVEKDGGEVRIFHLERLTRSDGGMRAEGFHCFIKRGGRNVEEVHAASAVWIPHSGRWRLSGAVAFVYDESGFRRRTEREHLSSSLRFADFRLGLSPSALTLEGLAELEDDPLYAFHYYRRFGFPLALLALAAVVTFLAPPRAESSLFMVLAAALAAAFGLYLADVAASALLPLLGPVPAACLPPGAALAAAAVAALRLRT